MQADCPPPMLKQDTTSLSFIAMSAPLGGGAWPVAMTPYLALALRARGGLNAVGGETITATVKYNHRHVPPHPFPRVMGMCGRHHPDHLYGVPLVHAHSPRLAPRPPRRLRDQYPAGPFSDAQRRMNCVVLLWPACRWVRRHHPILFISSLCPAHRRNRMLDPNLRPLQKHLRRATETVRMGHPRRLRQRHLRKRMTYYRI